jgi:hypothetical protein
MQIKPFEYIGQTEKDIRALKERNVKRSHRDFYIYDEQETNGIPGLSNNLCSGVVQVTKLLVKGMPDEEGYFYDRDRSERTTFVKSIYIYNAFMDSKIKNLSERFRKAVLRPIISVIGAYTDTKQGVDADFNQYEYVDNQFGISIFKFSSRSLMSILCNPVMVRDGLIAKTSRLDIMDPRDNHVRYLDKESSSLSNDIPSVFQGNDLLRNGESNLKTYNSYFKEHNSFTEENMLNISRSIYGNKYRLGYEEAGGLVPYKREGQTGVISDLIDKRRALDSFIIDITKASSYSLFESFTMQYESGKKSGFKVIKSPFKQYHVRFMEQKMVFVYTEFIKLCEKISEIYGDIRVLLHINDVEHVVKCIFLNDMSSTNRVIVVRKTKLDCINDYISETMYGRQDGLFGITRFKNEHDIDILNYYSYKNNGDSYMFRGNM